MLEPPCTERHLLAVVVDRLVHVQVGEIGKAHERRNVADIDRAPDFQGMAIKRQHLDPAPIVYDSVFRFISSSFLARAALLNAVAKSSGSGSEFMVRLSGPCVTM